MYQFILYHEKNPNQTIQQNSQNKYNLLIVVCLSYFIALLFLWSLFVDVPCVVG